MSYAYIENKYPGDSSVGFAGGLALALLVIIVTVSFSISNTFDANTQIIKNNSVPEKISLTVAQHRALVITLRKQRMSDRQLDSFMNRLDVDDATKAYIQRATEQRDWESQLNSIAGFSADYHIPKNINFDGQIIPAVMKGTGAQNICYKEPDNFRNYAFYPAREFLDANGWNMTSIRTYNELPLSIMDKVREIGDYLHAHYRYGTRKKYNGLGQDDDTTFDCDDFAALMYRMGRQAGLEMYIIDLPDHWANAVRYGNTLYTIEPQGYDKVRYRENVTVGARNVTQYALHTENIVVEKE
jgi:hypothetical protein